MGLPVPASTPHFGGCDDTLVAVSLAWLSQLVHAAQEARPIQYVVVELPSAPVASSCALLASATGSRPRLPRRWLGRCVWPRAGFPLPLRDCGRTPGAGPSKLAPSARSLPLACAARRVRHSPRTSAPGTLLVLPPLAASGAALVCASDPRCPRFPLLGLALPKLHFSFSAAAVMPALTPPCLLRRAGADRVASLQVHREALSPAEFQGLPPLALTPYRRRLATFPLQHQFALSFQLNLFSCRWRWRRKP